LRLDAREKVAGGNEIPQALQWRRRFRLAADSADDVAAVNRRVVLAVLRDAKLDVDSLHLPPGYLDT